MGGRARIRVATGLVAGIVAVGATAAAAGQTGPLTTTSEAASTSRVAQKHEAAGPCDGLATPTRPAYGWPVKPFHRQHPVRGHFGDPRIGGQPKGSVKTVHFGVDVSAPDGTPVYATTDGVPGSTGRSVVTIRARRTARCSRTGTSRRRCRRSAGHRVQDGHRPHHQGLGPRAFRRVPRRRVRQPAPSGGDGAVRGSHLPCRDGGSFRARRSTT